MANQRILVNLAVRDLKRSMDFFAQLGFSFNPEGKQAFADYWQSEQLPNSELLELLDALNQELVAS